MENSSRTVVCSVLFLDIVEYSTRSVADQSRVKESFNRTVSKALEAVAHRDRVILDTGDGAAIAFLGDPEDALFVALAIRDGSTLPVRMGLNLGPVRLVKDINGQANIIGDGINVAQRVMSFSQAGQLLVSRSFFEVASRLSSDYANWFKHEGLRSDKHVREHEVYSVGTQLRGKYEAAEVDLSRSARADDPGAALEYFSPVPGPAPSDDSLAARIFDAGANLIISGYSKQGVERALKELEQAGASVISPATRVNDKWIASCGQPARESAACKVATIEGKQIVTGPTREAVTSKVEELVHFGATLVSDISLTHGVWRAVCQTGDP